MPAAISGSSPIVTNSVVPIANPPRASAAIARPTWRADCTRAATRSVVVTSEEDISDPIHSAAIPSAWPLHIMEVFVWISGSAGGPTRSVEAALFRVREMTHATNQTLSGVRPHGDRCPGAQHGSPRQHGVRRPA